LTLVYNTYMKVSQVRAKQRWVIDCDPATVAAIKVLAAAKHQPMGATLDLAVEYFSRKVQFEKNKPLQWSLPDDF